MDSVQPPHEIAKQLVCTVSKTPSGATSQAAACKPEDQAAAKGITPLPPKEKRLEKYAKQGFTVRKKSTTTHGNSTRAEERQPPLEEKATAIKQTYKRPANRDHTEKSAADGSAKRSKNPDVQGQKSDAPNQNSSGERHPDKTRGDVPPKKKTGATTAACVVRLEKLPCAEQPTATSVPPTPSTPSDRPQKSTDSQDRQQQVLLVTGPTPAVAEPALPGPIPGIETGKAVPPTAAATTLSATQGQASRPPVVNEEPRREPRRGNASGGEWPLTDIIHPSEYGWPRVESTGNPVQFRSRSADGPRAPASIHRGNDYPRFPADECKPRFGQQDDRWRSTSRFGDQPMRRPAWSRGFIDGRRRQRDPGPTARSTRWLLARKRW